MFLVVEMCLRKAMNRAEFQACGHFSGVQGQALFVGPWMLCMQRAVSVFT